MNHTAEEIRALANVFEHGPVFDMLNAYAERIKADESAVAAGYIVVKEHTWQHDDGGRPTLAYLWPAEFGRKVFPTFEQASAFIRKEPGLPLGWVAMQIEFPHPPAQAAQVDALRWLAVSCDPHKLTGAFAVDHARRAFGMGPFKDDPSYATAEPAPNEDVVLRAIEADPSAAAEQFAEPVAQGEVVARLDDSGRADFERWARCNWSLEVDRDTSGNYNDRETRAAWASWREALRLAAQPRAVASDTLRLEYLITRENVVRRMRDSGLFMLLSNDGHPITGGEYETGREAIDDGMLAYPVAAAPSPGESA